MQNGISYAYIRPLYRHDETCHAIIPNVRPYQFHVAVNQQRL